MPHFEGFKFIFVKSAIFLAGLKELLFINGMSAKQYPDKIKFETTGDLMEWLGTNKGIRPPDNFSMVTLYIDEECLRFKSHKAVINCLMDVKFHCYFECFRNFGKGLTIKTLG